MALTDAVASLGASMRIRSTRPGPDSSERGPGSGEPVDVIVLEQTMTPASPERFARAASHAPGAPIVSVVAEGRGRYCWLRVRPTGALYRIEASGRGTLADAVQMATGLPSPDAPVGVRENLAR